MRDFEKLVCDAFNTVELPREAAARVRRQAQAAGKGTTTEGTGTRKARKLNLFTYKWHSLGDYANMIRRFGTTDSYSTQLVSHLITPPNDNDAN